MLNSFQTNLEAFLLSDIIPQPLLKLPILIINIRSLRSYSALWSLVLQACSYRELYPWCRERPGAISQYTLKIKADEEEQKNGGKIREEQRAISGFLELSSTILEQRGGDKRCCLSKILQARTVRIVSSSKTESKKKSKTNKNWWQHKTLSLPLFAAATKP